MSIMLGLHQMYDQKSIGASYRMETLQNHMGIAQELHYGLANDLRVTFDPFLSEL